MIIHITDTHLDSIDSFIRFNILIDLIIEEFTPHNHVIVFTGDIVKCGLDKQLLKKAADIIKKLEMEGFKVFCCPGNRDVGSDHQGIKSQLTFFNSLIRGREIISGPQISSFSVGHATYNMIYLETMPLSETWNKSLALEGKFGQHQLKKTKLLFEKLDFKKDVANVIYFHHSLFGFDGEYRIHDADLFTNLIKRNPHKIDAILFGHVHDGKCWHGKWGVPKIYGGGNSINPDADNFVFRVFDPLNRNNNEQCNQRIRNEFITLLNKEKLIKDYSI